MSRRDIARRFDDIVAFAEVGPFLDTPVKRYSSGMYVRLAFAVAAHLEPEVLIVDEVLAVGDAAFQKKCLGKMQSLSEGGRTVLFVSHNMPAVRSLTQRCLYLRAGQVVTVGPTAEVIDRYLADSWDHNKGVGEAGLDYYRRDRSRESPVRIVGVRVDGGDGGDPPTLRSGDDFTLRLTLRAARAVPGAYLTFWLTSQQGERVALFFSADAGFRPDLRPGEQELACGVHGLPLSPGRYSLTVGVNEGVSTVAFDVLVDYPALNVVLPGADDGGLEWPTRPWGCVHWGRVRWEGG
jgi:lipopolysaccharide transport system ATP-binding protein